MIEVPYWERKSLDEMTDAEWERLCDGCARCCLHKLQDVDTGDIFYTKTACRMLNLQTCRCKDYENREKNVVECTVLKPDRADELSMLPKSCAYRRIAEGRRLADWHPLVSGDPQSVHAAGISVRGKAVSETVSGPADENSEIYKLQ